MTGIQKVSIRHNEIMDYMMANPTMKGADVARYFGVTHSWLSQIIHSEAFQNLLKEKQDVAFHGTVMPLREKMTVIAHMALDKLADQIPSEVDTRTINDVTENMLDRLGYGSKPIQGGNLTINQQNNFVTPNASANEIAEARKLLEKANSSALGVIIDGGAAPITLPRESPPALGQTLPHPHIPFAFGTDTEGESGTEVREESTREAV
jgi:hypothetical protein